MRTTFQLKLFLIAFAAAALALTVAGAMLGSTMRRNTNARIEETLIAEALLAAELLSRTPALADRDIDLEADQIGERVGARVTFVAADGRVLGDSAEPYESLAVLENHARRPEIVAARTDGIGQARRRSATLTIDMLYVAARVAHPQIAFVRLALPLANARDQLRAVVLATLSALAIALAGAAIIAYVLARRLGRRVRAVAEIARRYRDGDLTPGRLDFGDDEIGVVGRALDQTVEQLTAHAGALARDRRRMATILAGMAEGVVVIDGSGRLQLANESARRMLRPIELAIGRPYIETIRHPAVTALVAAALEGRTPDPVQIVRPHDGGHTLSARATPSAADGGAVLVLHDVSELLHAERMRRDFVANVSHELRTPLTAIRGYLEALGEPDLTAGERRQFLEIATSHTLRMERLVKDLLRLARLDAGHEPASPVTCDTRAVVDAAVLDLEPALALRQQQVDVSVAPAAHILRADPAKLQDALRNLLANASAYSPPGARLRVDAARDGSVTKIAVSDEGPGIPEADLTRIFERFYRVDKSRTTDPGGTGLGLAIVKHLVELHGGRVYAENVAPTGARVTIELPPER